MTQPTRTPSWASLLSGAFPWVLKARMLDCHVPDAGDFSGHVLQRTGYRCVSIGKIHLVPQRAEPAAVRVALADVTGDGYREVDLHTVNSDRAWRA